MRGPKMLKAAAALTTLAYCSLLVYQGGVVYQGVKVQADQSPVTVSVPVIRSRLTTIPPRSQADITTTRKPPLNQEDVTETRIPRNITLDDIFITVKTTSKNENTRLPIILKTWFQLAKEQTWFFTDNGNATLQELTGNHMVNTNCSSSYDRKALCCKTSMEYDYFLLSGKKWFCHFDDDNYVNVPRLLQTLQGYDEKRHWYLGKPSIHKPIKMLIGEGRQFTPKHVKFWFATGGAGYCLSQRLARKMIPIASGGKFMSKCNRIALPDDVTMGYIIEYLLKQKLTVIPEFHSHYEDMKLIDVDKLQDQISFSYFSKKKNNVVQVPGLDERYDPTRWFCHFDDDNYVNVPRLLVILQRYNEEEDWYLGKPSLRNPVRIQTLAGMNYLPQRYVRFWFATGGAGYCLSKSLAQKMIPLASGGKFISQCNDRFVPKPDDVTMGYIIEHLLKKKLTVIPELHSQYEDMMSIDVDKLQDQISFGFSYEKNKKNNVVQVPGLDKRYDPTRFLSLHCFLFPDFEYCQ